MTTFHKNSFLLLILTAFICDMAAARQINNLSAEDDKLIKLNTKMWSFYRASNDSLVFYSEKFDREFINLVQKNPATMNYPFKRLADSNICDVKISGDGNLRIYSWDTWTGGTMHFFKEIYQWKASGKVYTKVPVFENGDPGTFCSAIFTIPINNTTYYLAVKNGIYSTKDAMQSVSAFSINGKSIDSVKLFKTKKELLNTINVYFDFFSVVDRPERPLRLITYDDKLKIVYIPLVGDKDQVTKKNLLYQLKGRYFEYIGVETGTRNPQPQ